MNETREQVSALADSLDQVALVGPAARLYEVTQELIGLHRELAMVLVAEKEAKIRAYHASNETSASARDRVAEYNAMGNTLEVLKLKGEIASFAEERDFLKLLLAASAGMGG